MVTMTAYQRMVIDYKNEILQSLREHYARGGYKGTGGEGNYCKHGTNLGYWDGPDYMCGWCEDGISDAEYAYYRAIDAVRAEFRNRRRIAADDFAEYFTSDWLKEHAETVQVALTDEERTAMIQHFVEIGRLVRGSKR